RVRSLSSSLWTLTHLTALHINDNNLTRIPPDIAKLPNLVYLNLSSNKLRSLPAELGNMVSLRTKARFRLCNQTTSNAAACVVLTGVTPLDRRNNDDTGQRWTARLFLRPEEG
ncbi:hypothetical protein GOODEAATRI_014648, partial [Goodea atripinnis]